MSISGTGSGEVPDFHELKKYVSPELMRKTEGKGNLAIGRQVLKNIAKKLSTKIHRIGNRLGGGEWVNNAAVARKLSAALTQFIEDAYQLNRSKTSIDTQGIQNFLDKATSSAVAIEKILNKNKKDESLKKVAEQKNELSKQIAELSNKEDKPVEQPTTVAEELGFDAEDLEIEDTKDIDTPEAITSKFKEVAKIVAYCVDLTEEINEAKEIQESKKVAEGLKKSVPIAKEGVSKETYQKYGALLNELKMKNERKTEAQPQVSEVEIPFTQPTTPIGKIEHRLQAFILMARKEHGFLDDSGETAAKTYQPLDNSRVDEFKRLIADGLVGETIEEMADHAEFLLEQIDKELVRENLAQKQKQGFTNVRPEHKVLKREHSEMHKEIGALLDEIRVENATVEQSALINKVKGFIEEARRHGFADSKGESVKKVNKPLPKERLAALNAFMESEPRGMSIEDAEEAVLDIKDHIDRELVRVGLATKGKGGIQVTENRLRALYASLVDDVQSIQDERDGYESAEDGSSWEYKSFDD